MNAFDRMPGYDDLDLALHEAGVTTSAAEAHGVITGVVCAATAQTHGWLPAILGRRDPRERQGLAQVTPLLGALHAETEAALAAREFDFRLLLPGDECGLPERVDALADWCRGFVLGLMQAGIQDLQALPPDAAEVVDDIMQIGEATADGVGGDQDERALLELQEYVRLAAQLVYGELHAVP